MKKEGTLLSHFIRPTLSLIPKQARKLQIFKTGKLQIRFSYEHNHTNPKQIINAWNPAIHKKKDNISYPSWICPRNTNLI